jgi:hypothetical protein
MEVKFVIDSKKHFNSLFLLLCIVLWQPLYVSKIQAMDASISAAVAQQEPSLCEQVRDLAVYVQKNKARTAYALVPFLNFKAYGLSDAASASLQLFPKFQEVIYGKEDVTNQDIIRLIRNELAALNVPDHNKIPIKKKTGRFESAYESIIVHPTNKIIYVDEDFLKRQDSQLREFIIKTALKHYLNGTFGKVSLMQLSFAIASMKVMPKAQSFLKKLVRDGARSFFAQPTDGTDSVSEGSFMHKVGGFAVNMAVTAGTLWAWNKAKNATLKGYIGHVQGGFDRQVADKARAKQLLGAVAKDAQELTRSGIDERMQHDALQERLNLYIEDELSAEWAGLMASYGQNEANLLGLVCKFDDFFRKVPKSDTRKRQAAAIIKELVARYSPTLAT